MKKQLLFLIALGLSSTGCMQALIFDHHHDDDYYDDRYHHGVVSGTVHAADDVADAGLGIATLGAWNHRHDQHDDSNAQRNSDRRSRHNNRRYHRN